MIFKCLGNIFGLQPSSSISTTSPHDIFAASNFDGTAGFVAGDSNTYEIFSGARGSDGGQGHARDHPEFLEVAVQPVLDQFCRRNVNVQAAQTVQSKKFIPMALSSVVNKIMPAIFIKCYNFKANGNISNAGLAGSTGEAMSELGQLKPQQVAVRAVGAVGIFISVPKTT